jgi:hypothetical protein
MTELQKYQESAKNFVESHRDSEVRRMYGHHFRSYLAGCIHADHIGFQRALSQVETIIKTSPLGETEKFYLLEKIKLMKA